MSRREKLRELFGEFSSDDELLLDGTKDPPPPNPPPPLPTMSTSRPERTEQRPPRVGTSIQRSDAINRRKAVWLTTPSPPPPTTRRRQPVPTRRSSATAKPLPGPSTSAPSCAAATAPPAKSVTAPTPPPGRDCGNAGPTRPPIKIQVAPGTILTVPYHAAHSVRRFRSWTPEGKWILRFGPNGQLRSSRFRPRPTTTASAATAPPPKKGGDVTMQ
ncbi:hypothetical protein CAJAP_02705 [Camponotus japonicus]